MSFKVKMMAVINTDTTPEYVQQQKDWCTRAGMTEFRSGEWSMMLDLTQAATFQAINDVMQLMIYCGTAGGVEVQQDR